MQVLHRSHVSPSFFTDAPPHLCNVSSESASTCSATGSSWRARVLSGVFCHSEATSKDLLRVNGRTVKY